MAPRQSLQIILEALMGDDPHVYFQPPTDAQMVYPAIVYERNPAQTNHADNKPFRISKQYQVTLVARDPDEALWQKLAELPTCSHERFFVADNLNHDVFTLYF
jgi:hypothetical protein